MLFLTNFFTVICLCFCTDMILFVRSVSPISWANRIVAVVTAAVRVKTNFCDLATFSGKSLYSNFISPPKNFNFSSSDNCKTSFVDIFIRFNPFAFRHVANSTSDAVGCRDDNIILCDVETNEITRGWHFRAITKLRMTCKSTSRTRLAETYVSWHTVVGRTEEMEAEENAQTVPREFLFYLSFLR